MFSNIAGGLAADSVLAREFFTPICASFDRGVVGHRFDCCCCLKLHTTVAAHGCIRYRRWCLLCRQSATAAVWHAGGVPLSRVRRWFNLIPTLTVAVCTLSLLWVRRPLVVVGIMAMQNLALGFKNAGIGPVTMELSRT